MFVGGLEISNHHQFKDFKLDLTYPKGHKLEGQALRKVCFIGQSGTGKTTLLEEIWNSRQKGNTTGQRSTIPIKNIRISRIKQSGLSVLFTMNQKVNTSITNSYLVIFPLYVYTNNNLSGWVKLINKVSQHQTQKFRYGQKISSAFLKGNTKQAEIYAQQLRKWQAENDTPLEDLADQYLNPILKDFNLEVKTDFESLDQVKNIHLINKTTLQVIPMQHWSSGVENIISRTLPLYTHQFKNATICVDEPENSLYPDIQRKIIDIYTKLAPDSQFFFATHSPLIASSFEPWEIVELKFNEEGYVYREVYYEGENHVDNYKYYPQYLRWDAILQNIFDLENDGSEARQELLQQFSNLDTKLKARKAKGEQLSKDDPEVKELLEMGKKLGWDTK